MSKPHSPVRVWFGGALTLLILAGGILGGVRHLWGATSQSSVEAGNADPVVSAVSLNNGSPITLTAGTTTVIRVNFTVSDNNGCGDVFFNGGVSTTVYRSGAGAGCSLNALNCYIQSITTHSCPFATTTQTSANATTTFSIYYFGQATDASSSFSSQNWLASVSAWDASSSAATATSTGIELNTLLAIESTSSSLNYGTVTAGADTGATNQIAGIKNAGNASTTLDISGTSLTSGSQIITTSSQHYATSTFTYGGVEQALTDAAQAVSGFLISRPAVEGFMVTTALPSDLGSTHNSVQASDYLYAAGGTTNGTTTVFFAPLHATGSVGDWTAATPLPKAIGSHGIAGYNAFLYVLGGLSSSNPIADVYFAPINSTGSLGTWATTTPLPQSSYQHRFSAVARENFMYVAGLYNSTNTSEVWLAPINATGSLGTWATTTPLPSPMRSFALVPGDSFMYAVGGFDSTASSTVLFAPINATGSLGAWQATTPLVSAMSGNPAHANSGFLYIPQGGNVHFAPLASNGSVGEWSSLSQGSVFSYSTAAYGRRIYRIGGSGTTTVSFSALATKDTYWGLAVPGGTATGTYTGTNTFTAIFSP